MPVSLASVNDGCLFYLEYYFCLVLKPRWRSRQNIPIFCDLFIVPCLLTFIIAEAVLHLFFNMIKLSRCLLFVNCLTGVVMNSRLCTDERSLNKDLIYSFNVL